MKKVSKKKLIEILTNKSNFTYNELSILTGYHPKSLTRIHSMIKKGKYNINKNKKEEIYKSIITDYLNSKYKTYRSFYKNNQFKYNISYSTLCKILKSVKPNDELVLVRKVKNKENYNFEIIDYKNNSILFTYNSSKNDIKSMKEIIYLLIKNYGSPNNISFVNFFTNTPASIQNILSNYNINIVIFKSIYRNCFNHLLKKKNIKYSKKQITKEDFYNTTTRKTIANNKIQFNNIRYKIKTKYLIKQNTKIVLYYNNSKTDIFIKYNNSIYRTIPTKKIYSKKGTSKY